MGWASAFAIVGTIVGVAWALGFMIWATLKYGPKEGSRDDTRQEDDHPR